MSTSHTMYSMTVTSIYTSLFTFGVKVNFVFAILEPQAAIEQAAWLHTLRDYGAIIDIQL